MDASTSREYDRETFIRALSQAHLRDEYFESKLQKVISAISRYARLLFDGFTEHHSPIPHTAFYKRFYPQNEGYGDPTSPNPGSLICAIMNELPTLDICSQMSITWQLALAITGTGAWSLEVNGSWNSQENIAKETTDLLISRHAQAKTWMQVPDEVWIRLQVFCEALVSLVIVPSMPLDASLEFGADVEQWLPLTRRSLAILFGPRSFSTNVVLRLATVHQSGETLKSLKVGACREIGIGVLSVGMRQRETVILT